MTHDSEQQCLCQRDPRASTNYLKVCTSDRDLWGGWGQGGSTRSALINRDRNNNVCPAKKIIKIKYCIFEFSKYYKILLSPRQFFKQPFSNSLYHLSLHLYTWKNIWAQETSSIISQQIRYADPSCYKYPNINLCPEKCSVTQGTLPYLLSWCNRLPTMNQWQ